MEASVCGTVRCIWPRDQSGEKQRLDGTKSLESRYCVVSKFAHKRGRSVSGRVYQFPHLQNVNMHAYLTELHISVYGK